MRGASFIRVPHRSRCDLISIVWERMTFVKGVSRESKGPSHLDSPVHSIWLICAQSICVRISERVSKIRLLFLECTAMCPTMCYTMNIYTNVPPPPPPLGAMCADPNPATYIQHLHTRFNRTAGRHRELNFHTGARPRARVRVYCTC